MNNFKVICVKGDNNFITKGKIYEFIDGVTTWDNRRCSSYYKDYIDLIKRNLSFQSLLEPYNEDDYELNILQVLQLDVDSKVISNDGEVWIVQRNFNDKKFLKNVINLKRMVLDSETLELKFKIEEKPYKIESFLEAIKAYEDGSVIGCKTNHNFNIYEPKESRLNLDCNQILNGEWLIYKKR